MHNFPLERQIGRRHRPGAFLTMSPRWTPAARTSSGHALAVEDDGLSLSRQHTLSEGSAGFGASPPLTLSPRARGLSTHGLSQNGYTQGAGLGVWSLCALALRRMSLSLCLSPLASGPTCMYIYIYYLYHIIYIYIYILYYTHYAHYISYIVKLYMYIYIYTHIIIILVIIVIITIYIYYIQYILYRIQYTYIYIYVYMYMYNIPPTHMHVHVLYRIQLSI